MQSAFRILAWGSIVAIVIATDLPIAFRPVTYLSANMERIIALALVGMLFVLAYPKRILTIGAVLMAAILVFEFAQIAVAGRHPRVVDAAYKSMGLMLGLALGYLCSSIMSKREARRL